MNAINIYFPLDTTFRMDANAKVAWKFNYESPLSGKAACNEAFHIFNAPHELLKEKEQMIATQYRAKRLRSLSVGDVVEVVTNENGKPTYQSFVCASFGWEPFEMKKD